MPWFEHHGHCHGYGYGPMLRLSVYHTNRRYWVLDQLLSCVDVVDVRHFLHVELVQGSGMGKGLFLTP